MNRIHLAMAASVLLYLGAVMAGWGASPVAAWPVFLGIFLLWSILMRPDEWPRDGARWVETGVILRALTATGVMAGLSLACLSLGWMLARVVPLPEVGPWPGVLLSLVGVGASRLVWNPFRAQAADPALDEALRQVGAAPPDDAARAAARQRREEMEVDAVIAFTADTPPDRVAEVMADLTLRFAPARLAEGFARLRKGGRMNAPQMRALVLLATDPDHARRLKGHEVAALAFQCCHEDAGLLDLFARRYGALIEAMPDMIGDGPSTPLLRQVETAQDGTPAAQVIRALRERQVRIARGRGEALAAGGENP